MGAGVNPYHVIVADRLKTPCCFGFKFLHVPVFVVMLLLRSTVTVKALTIDNLLRRAYASVTPTSIPFAPPRL